MIEWDGRWEGEEKEGMWGGVIHAECFKMLYMETNYCKSLLKYVHMQSEFKWSYHIMGWRNNTSTRHHVLPDNSSSTGIGYNVRVVDQWVPRDLSPSLQTMANAIAENTTLLRHRTWRNADGTQLDTSSLQIVFIVLEALCLLLEEKHHRSHLVITPANCSGDLLTRYTHWGNSVQHIS